MVYILFSTVDKRVLIAKNIILVNKIVDYTTIVSTLDTRVLMELLYAVWNSYQLENMPFLEPS